jgi:hypothetical protein
MLINKLTGLNYADITPENLHGEWDTGPAVGGEVV